jgi:carboxyl-terminal processing protease
MRLRFILAASPLAVAWLSFLSAQGAPQPPEPRSAAEFAADADTNDAVVAQIAANKIQDWNFAQHPFDEEISSKFLDRYLDILDYSHVFFLQSDIREFDKYRSNLNVLTLQDRDISPCWVIFARFMERLHQRVDLVSNLLQDAHFDFAGHDRFVLNRHALPYAKDLDEARENWRQALRCEYLDQLLNSPDVQFAGMITTNAQHNLLVKLTRDKIHPSSLSYLPPELKDHDGHAFGWCQAASSQSNATLRLALPARETLRKTTNHFYTAAGAEVGEITYRREIVKPDTNAASSTNHPAIATTNYEASIHLHQKDPEEIRKTIGKHYTQMLKNYIMAIEEDRPFELYVNSLARAYDPHSDFMGHMSAENFDIQMKLSLFGIGALLGMVDDYCTIEELKEGPAKKSGKMHDHDRIVGVAQSNAEPVDVEGLPLDKIVGMIRGPKGTEVTLTIIPFDAPDTTVRRHVSLIRDEIRLEDQDAKALLYENPDVTTPESRIGVIEAHSFYGDSEGPRAGDGSRNQPKSMTLDVQRLIRRLKRENVGGIILDLRQNGGGYLEEATRLTGLFIPSGPVVQTKDSTGEIVTDPCHDKSVLYDGPLIVLTSRLSASASEILAGALQDYHRAIIVGDHSTFGKGTVQTKQSLKPYLMSFFHKKNLAYDQDYDPGSLKITIKKFYRAGGVSTQFKGVLSDIELPSVLNYATNEVGESALPNALPCDEVTSDNPENLNRVKPYLPALLRRSRERVAASKDFAYIQQDIADFLKQQADKSISLNLADRKAEQEAKTARQDAIKKERLSRSKSDEKIFEITLKNVDLAQLEPPPAKTNAPPALASNEPAFDDESDFDQEAASQEASIDPVLDEARHIMADYIALVNNEPVISQASGSPSVK